MFQGANGSTRQLPSLQFLHSRDS
ncbi:hypothetical protein LINPERPRIM_LOCUS25147 [Linum perenne]